MTDRLNITIGGREVCAWQTAPGVTWVQTRSPLLARKLGQRSDAKLVAKGVAGGYLRIFEFNHPLSWAQRWIDRQTKKRTPTNEAFSDPKLARAGRNLLTQCGQEVACSS